MKTASLLHYGKKELKEKGIESSSLDAEVLLSHLLQKDRIHIIAEPEKELNQLQVDLYEKLIKERSSHKPVAYIIGKKEFYGLDFTVNPSVLIPRPETEQLVDMVLYYTPLNGSLLDIGTGSGAIAITSQFSRADIDVYASDVSFEALETARLNQNEILKEECISLIQSDLFENIPSMKFDCIVSNPPYVNPEEKESLAKDLMFEPEIALFAEQKGTEILGRIFEEALEFLKPEGKLLCEIGYDQSDFMKEKGREHGFSVSMLTDLAGLSRIAICSPVTGTDS